MSLEVKHEEFKCGSGTLKKAPAFLIVKNVIILAFLSSTFKSQHRKMLFLLQDYVRDLQDEANGGHVNQPNLDHLRQNEGLSKGLKLSVMYSGAM